MYIPDGFDHEKYVQHYINEAKRLTTALREFQEKYLLDDRLTEDDVSEIRAEIFDNLK